MANVCVQTVIDIAHVAIHLKIIFLIARLKFVQHFAFLRHITAISSVGKILLMQAPFHFNSIDILPIFPSRRHRLKRSNQTADGDRKSVGCLGQTESESWRMNSYISYFIYRFSLAQYENIGVLHYSFHFQSSSMDFRDDPINQLFAAQRTFLNIWMRGFHNIFAGLLFAFIRVLISIFLLLVDCDGKYRWTSLKSRKYESVSGFSE